VKYIKWVFLVYLRKRGLFPEDEMIHLLKERKQTVSIKGEK